MRQSKDVISQAQAVAGLAALQPVHEGVIDVLAAALRRPTLFCRVRADAALALGATAGDATHMRGAHALVGYWRCAVMCNRSYTRLRLGPGVGEAPFSSRPLSFDRRNSRNTWPSVGRGDARIAHSNGHGAPQNPPHSTHPPLFHNPLVD
jgi:hypothetical protein